MRFLFVLFVVVPLCELGLLFQVSGVIGTLPTIAVILLTAALGAALARRQGLATLTRFQAKLAEGVVAQDEILGGVAILVAAALLLTPGFLTDAAGFALLVPWLRRRMARWIAPRLLARMVVHTGTGNPFNAGVPENEEIRETEVAVLEDEGEDPGRHSSSS